MVVVSEVMIRGQPTDGALHRIDWRRAGGKAFEHRRGDPRYAMLSSLSRRSGDAISNGVGSIEFWGTFL